MRRAALIAFALGLVAVLAFEAVPWLSRKRDFPSEIPSPPALVSVSLQDIAPGQYICMNNIVAEQHSHQARFQVGTYKKPGPALELTIEAPGYRTVARQPPGYADNAVIALPIRAPVRPTLVTACITNRGKTKIALYSAQDRAHSKAGVWTEGTPLPATPAFGFWEGRGASIVDRAGLTVERMSTFRGFLGHPWLIWLLLVLFGVGMPVALGVALWRGFPR